MHRFCAIFAALLLLAAALPAHAVDESELPYDAAKAPLSQDDLQLLTDNGYRPQKDGPILAPDGSRFILRAELPMLLDELLSRQKLKAMLELTVIFNRYGYKKLPEEVLAQIRKISKQNWSVLPARVRGDLKPYFKPEEIAALNSGVRPLRAEQLFFPKDTPPPPPPPQPTIAVSTAQIPAAAASASTTTIAGIVAAPIAPSVLPTPAPTQTPAVPTPAVAQAVSSSVVVQAPYAIAPTAQARIEPVAAASPGAASVTLPAPVVEAMKTPPAPAAAASAPAASPAAPQPIAASPMGVLSGDYPELSAKAFEDYLNAAPYGHEVRLLLELVYKHTPVQARREALGYLAKFSPQVVIDGKRCADHLRAKTARAADAAVIALSPGPLLVTRRKLLLENEDYLLADATGFYKAMDVPPPTTQAAVGGVAAERIIGTSWGKALEYSDGSRRLSFTPEQMAGTLLEELLRLAAAKRGWESDELHVALWARVAEFGFFRSFERETGGAPLLDLDLEAGYREWLVRPDDYADLFLQAWSSPLLTGSTKGAAAEERKELKRFHAVRLLENAGTITSKEAKASLGPLLQAAPAELASDVAAPTLENATGVRAHWLTQERQLRNEIEAKN